MHIHKIGDNIGTQNSYHGSAPDTQQISNLNSEAVKEIITAAAIEEIETNKTSLRDRLVAAFKAGLEAKPKK